jgi:uncharacterized membrane protein
VEKPYHESDTIFVFLAYFGFLSALPFFLLRDQRDDPKKEYVYWHARQGLALALCVLCLSMVLLMVYMFVGWIPIFGWAVAATGCCVWPSYLLVIIGSHALCWYKAFTGERWAFPGVCRVAEMFH